MNRLDHASSTQKPFVGMLRIGVNHVQCWREPCVPETSLHLHPIVSGLLKAFRTGLQGLGMALPQAMAPCHWQCPVSKWPGCYGEWVIVSCRADNFALTLHVRMLGHICNGSQRSAGLVLPNQSLGCQQYQRLAVQSCSVFTGGI